MTRQELKTQAQQPAEPYVAYAPPVRRDVDAQYQRKETNMKPVGRTRSLDEASRELHLQTDELLKLLPNVGIDTNAVHGRRFRPDEFEALLNAAKPFRVIPTASGVATMTLEQMNGLMRRTGAISTSHGPALHFKTRHDAENVCAKLKAQTNPDSWTVT